MEIQLSIIVVIGVIVFIISIYEDPCLVDVSNVSRINSLFLRICVSSFNDTWNECYMPEGVSIFGFRPFPGSRPFCPIVFEKITVEFRRASCCEIHLQCKTMYYLEAITIYGNFVLLFR